ncbi:ribosomal protection-like ABC-F family protein [Papillibacter cinnamivorans]|uniref:ATPase components of ABC transporters with duplicated ATPase domains n=1 Tax=Papillibacter cinnamivorans DSM 12816 TaxID=1122930 RepID=A0A1W1YJ07_9FIRM|nr:ABC-F family ATP-binding cassette domain-containing protein [Papillibacter cinnamivorans]SMC36210.1 ATPase components of ABC transporters with duplicated ATPase domains [Papillibacter cinnamivorans DSM 12816]
MTDILVSGLVKSFEIGKNILDGLTFQVFAGERVGLLGRNGAGKTTVFRILAGLMGYDEGEVFLSPGRRLGLISQIPVYPEGFVVEDVLRSAFSEVFALQSEMDALANAMAEDPSEANLKKYGELSARFEALGGYGAETALNKVSNGLELSSMRDRLFDTLSGGEKTRVNLARLILEDTDILLLDEPTNHLDIRSVEWLEDYLSSFRGTVLVISHDRYFLDSVVTRIVELENGKAELYSGNYSFYAEEKEARYQERLRRYEIEEAKIAQLSFAAERMHGWAQRNAKLHRRAFAMEKRIERMKKTERPVKEREMKARFRSMEFHGDEVLMLDSVSKSFGERTLFRSLELLVEGGDRIALIGDNGTGKTTLLRILLGEEPPDTGRLRLGPAVRAAFLPQVVRFEHPERSLMDTLLYELDCTPQAARNRLAAFRFQGEDVYKPVSVLSGGEQSRLRLCMLMDGSINFLILDEPTNHLDIQSREWIESALEEYEGTLLFVSHDRYFVSRFATRIWELRDGGLTDFDGDYETYRALCAKEEKSPREGKEESRKEPRRKPGKSSGPDPLSLCEEEIAFLEERGRKIEGELEALANQGTSYDYMKSAELRRESDELEGRLEELYLTWETLAEGKESI